MEEGGRSSPKDTCGAYRCGREPEYLDFSSLQPVTIGARARDHARKKAASHDQYYAFKHSEVRSISRE